MTAASDTFWQEIQARADALKAEHARRLSVPCPQPRCNAPIGQPCRTPNGWAAHHKARERALAGTPAAKPHKHRLTDPQAEWIEWTAEAGVTYAADQRANYGGDARNRTVADALLKHGYVEQFDTTGDGERKLRLTAEGWRAYWHHKLIIRRLPNGRHETTCPCVKPNGAEAAVTPWWDHHHPDYPNGIYHIRIECGDVTIAKTEIR